MDLTSSAFEDGRPIPRDHTCDGRDISPPLNWTDAPNGTEEFAILVEDLDSPRRPFYNWVFWGIPGPVKQIPEAVPKVGREHHLIARQGVNSFTYDYNGYRGPSPLKGEKRRYVFKLYALKKRIHLVGRTTGVELLRALKPYVLEEATLRGTYER
jgi:Raf kinase inhibitor-like YbhB/YbcL family protein